MHYFNLKENTLWAEEVPIKKIVEKYGTPIYIYSARTLKRHFHAFDSAFHAIPHITCFSVKCNSNLHVLRVLKEEGAGADIVSGGELYRALRAEIDPKKIVFSGVGKQEHEIREALYADILMFNVESMQELEKINEIAISLNKRARVSFRINPDVDPNTHPYISTGLKQNKFGIDINDAIYAYSTAKELKGIEPIGIDCHIGSQLTEISPFLEALDKLKILYMELKERGIQIKYLDIGGGLGITYKEEEPPHPKEFGEALSKSLAGYPLTLILEPGRVIAGNAGILVTKVIYTKETHTKNFLIVDAGMNDLIRPSLYGSYHRIAEVTPMGRETKKYDIVGPICESGDFLAKDRELPEIYPGELLCVFSAGAYGFVMSSQYNSRPRAAEVMVSGDEFFLIRERETYRDLVYLEENLLK
jgi:diaminopimelate decarboxylase